VRGAGRHLSRSARRLTVTALWLAWSGAGASQAAAQVRPDSIQVPSDSARVLTDSAGVAADGTGPAPADSVSADTIFYNLPRMEHGAPPGFATGIWEWDHEAIMASGANTLAELVAEVPGLVVLLGGDYGTPVAISAFGMGGGGVRVLRDGFEVFPLEGGVADLQRVGLVGVTHVRLERAGGELLLQVTDYPYDDGRSFSLVEAGTGQLDTNAFRGTFADPTALGGSIALGLERVDTRGYGTGEGGNRTGTWFRYQLHRGDRAGLAFDYRRMGSETQVLEYAGSVRRTDLALRGRVEVADGLVLEAYTGRSSHHVDDARTAYDFEGGTRAQHGLRIAGIRGGLWARGAFRLYPDDDFPSRRFDAAAGYQAGRLGASGHLAQADWNGESVLGYGGSAWLVPFTGLSLFGAVDAGTYAARSGPPLDVLPDSTPAPSPPPGPTFATTERTVLRLGGTVSLAGATLAAAGLRADNDVHLPLGIELDRGSPVVGGADRMGVEAWASLPTRWRALRLEGSYQYWDRAGPYLPKQIYQGALVFRRTYLESGNFELWWSLGVRGYDPMEVFVADDGQGGPGGLALVPFYQSWYGRIQARILTVRLFLGWENFTIRRNLQNFPGRLLPITRSFFGLHWDLWN
jgi:hypothetical protein